MRAGDEAGAAGGAVPDPAGSAAAPPATRSRRESRVREQNFQNGHMGDTDLPWGPSGPSRIWLEVAVGSGASAVFMSAFTLAALSFCGLFRV